jgi:hypothetical protein
VQHDAWRLETLPSYSVPQEAEKLNRFLTGETSPDDHTSGWMNRVQKWGAEGKKAGRVHVVTRPLSPYIRFEFEYYYRHHVRAGEDIRILDITDRGNPGLPDQDFWMFDDSTVVLMNYRPDGTQINRELYEGDPEPFRRYKRIAVTESVPFLEYVGG